MPSVLGSGGDLIVSLTNGEMVLSVVIVTFAVKVLFSAVSFGSGAPGGIFFPFFFWELSLVGRFPWYVWNFSGWIRCI